MIKICTASGKKFEIIEDDLKFYEKMGIPSPTLCPEERQRRRIAFRNFMNLYHRECGATGKKIISMYSADKSFPVYDNDYWWSDKWSPQDFAQEFDFGRSFFEQYAELASKVPRFSIFNIKSENCRYANFSWEAKNCYLVFGCVRNEDCLYGHIVWDCKNCVDDLYLSWSEWCSNCVDCVRCYDTHFSTECASCTESYFLHDCRNCSNCFACTNLRNKQYCFLNEQLTKEEYEEKMKSILPLTHNTIESGKKWLEDLKREKCVFPPYFGLKNENVSGNHIYESKNVQQSFDVKKAEDSSYLYTTYGQVNCYDISYTGQETELCCDCLTVHGVRDVVFSHAINYSNDVAYSEFCYSSHDLFGCHGMRNAEYCIFNKQYSKEEYFELRGKIVEHMKDPSTSSGRCAEWGEFFPVSVSPFGYNETMAQAYFPLTKEEVLDRGWKWKDEEEKAEYIGPKYLVPETIGEVSDDVLEAVLTCVVTGKNYRIVKSELEFHRKMGIPLPKLCPDARHEERMAVRTPRELFERECGKCGKLVQTSYEEGRPEKVFCEECYLGEVV